MRRLNYMALLKNVSYKAHVANEKVHKMIWVQLECMMILIRLKKRNFLHGIDNFAGEQEVEEDRRRRTSRTMRKWQSSVVVFIIIWFYGLSRLFHSFWVESIVRWGENGISPRKNTWPPASRTWIVSHVTRARLEPTAVRWRAIKSVKD